MLQGSLLEQVSRSTGRHNNPLELKMQLHVYILKESSAVQVAQAPLLGRTVMAGVTETGETKLTLSFAKEHFTFSDKPHMKEGICRGQR
jgi:hypothetical protein